VYIAVLVEHCDPLQFVRVRDHINLPYLSIEHIQCQNNRRHTIAIMDNSSLPIDEGYMETRILRRFPQNAEEISRHSVRAVDRIASRRSLATAISIDHDIVSKQVQEAIYIAIPTRAEKLMQDSILLLPGSMIQRVTRSQVLTRSAHDLATIVLALLHHRRDFSIVIAKDLAQQEDGTL